MIPENRGLDLLARIVFGLVLVLSLWWGVENARDRKKSNVNAGKDIRNFPDEMQ
jgi:hypothetical protein